MDLTEFQQDIQTATMLIRLGVTTAQAIRALFKEDGHDDETIDAILADVDRRIARRS